MAADTLFSDSWHLVSNQRVSLRPSVRVRRQSFRGDLWYVLGDPYNNRYFRFRPEAWFFLSRLDGKRTVEEVWDECLQLSPGQTPGQQEVIQALATLHTASLLMSDLSPDSERLFERLREKKLRNVQQQLKSFLFFRVPLWDPDRFLNALGLLIRALFSRVGAIAWLLLMVLGLKVAAENAEDLWAQGREVLHPGNLLWLYLTWSVVKIFHEMGHAAACKRFGGEVHTMGVMFLVFTPIPYMDASAAWAFRERWKRVLVGCAGMMSEFVFAVVALLVWAQTGPGMVNQIAYNTVFLASVSTFLFNINPLLRFDGYYILSDLVDAPNLHQYAGRQWKHMIEHHGFGVRDSFPAGRTPRESFWLAAFGLGSSVYRVFILCFIVLFIAGQFFGLGLVIAAFSVVIWLIIPVGKGILYLMSNPKLDRCRTRATTVALGTVGVVAAFISLFPYPAHFRAPGVVRADRIQGVTLGTQGFIREILVPSGQSVVAGQPLFVLQDIELETDLRRQEALAEETRLRIEWAMESNPASIEPMRASLRAVQERIARLEERRQALVVRAPLTGLWMAPEIDQYLGAWVRRGTAVGQVVDPGAWHFSAVVSQRESGTLFSEEILRAEVRLFGQAGYVQRSQEWEIAVGDQTALPTAALGYLGGGPVAVSREDEQGRRTVEPFFEVRVRLREEDPLALRHLRSGVARFKLHSRPLATQWWRSFRQLLQERYQI